jgi:hypothetical protein
MAALETIADEIQEGCASHNQKDRQLTLLNSPRGSAKNHKTSEQRQVFGELFQKTGDHGGR